MSANVSTAKVNKVFQVVSGRVHIHECWFDESRNLRIDYSDCMPNPDFNMDVDVDASKIANQPNPGFYEDIQFNGVLTPLDVSILTGTELTACHEKAMKAFLSAGMKPAEAKKRVAMIKYRGFRGHRRMRVLLNLHALYPKDEKYSHVPVNMYKGMSYDDEMDKLVDQFGVKGLNNVEIVNAIKTLANCNLSQVQIASRIQMSKGFVQRRMWILAFPPFVLEAWKNYMLKKSDVTVVDLTDTRIVTLNVAANEDRSANRSLVDANSKFMTTWEKMIASKAADGKGNGDGSKDRNKKAKSRSDIQGDLDRNLDMDTIIRSVLEYVIGSQSVSLQTLDAECKTLRSKAASYDAIKKSEAAAAKTTKNGTSKK